MGYLWDAEDYERHSSPQQWAHDIIRTLKLTGNERALDIGCGDGKVAEELAVRLSNGSVVGIDNAETMIDFAHQRFPPTFFPNLQFRWGGATCLAYSSNLTSSYRLRVFIGCATTWRCLPE